MSFCFEIDPNRFTKAESVRIIVASFLLGATIVQAAVGQGATTTLLVAAIAGLIFNPQSYADWEYRINGDARRLGAYLGLINAALTATDLPGDREKSFLLAMTSISMHNKSPLFQDPETILRVYQERDPKALEELHQIQNELCRKQEELPLRVRDVAFDSYSNVVSTYLERM